MDITLPELPDFLDGPPLPCRTDPEAFFPIKGSATRAAEAKAACINHCPARQRCLDWALERKVMHGVWGGKSADERRVLLGGAPTPRGEACTECDQPRDGLSARCAQHRAAWRAARAAARGRPSRACTTCGKVKPIKAQGKCDACYSRMRRRKKQESIA